MISRITLRDLLTFTLGTGMVPAEPGTIPIADALKAFQSEPEPLPDEWIARLGALPLVCQPGERWMYHTAANVTGVLIARATGELVVEDGPDGYWSRPPAFEDGGGGLVSTASDYLAFASALLAGGARDGERVLSPPSVTLMTTDHLTPAQKALNSSSRACRSKRYAAGTQRAGRWCPASPGPSGARGRPPPRPARNRV